jgi:hypothetical protein
LKHAAVFTSRHGSQSWIIGGPRPTKVQCPLHPQQQTKRSIVAELARIATGIDPGSGVTRRDASVGQVRQ